MKDNSIKEHNLASVLFGHSSGVLISASRLAATIVNIFQGRPQFTSDIINSVIISPNGYTYFSVNLVLQVEHAKQFTHHALFKAETTTKEQRKDKMNQTDCIYYHTFIAYVMELILTKTNTRLSKSSHVL